MSNILKGLDSKNELNQTLRIQKDQLAKITAAKESLRLFNMEAAQKIGRVAKNFESNAKILEKVKDDLTFIHKAIKSLEKHFKDDE